MLFEYPDQLIDLDQQIHSRRQRETFIHTLEQCRRSLPRPSRSVLVCHEHLEQIDCAAGSVQIPAQAEILADGCPGGAAGADPRAAVKTLRTSLVRVSQLLAYLLVDML